MKHGVWAFAAIGLAFCTVAQVPAQEPPAPPPAQQALDYVVGPGDALAITSYDQPDLTATFTVEIDGTFTYPMIGRFSVSGKTLREVEAQLRAELTDRGIFKAPDVTVAIEQYRSQKVYIVGEVRNPGAYPLSGDMRLVEALALAGSMLPTASGEAVIVSQSSEALVVGTTPTGQPAERSDNVVRTDVRKLENGDLSQNFALTSGDTIFVLRAESVYVFGHARNPGAYPLRQKDTTVLQALSLAGGVTDRGSTRRIKIVRIVEGEKEEFSAELTDFVLPHDTVVVSERFF